MVRVTRLWLWLWLLLCFALALWILIITWVKAFSGPWRWTQDQVFAALGGVALLVGLARWGSIWWRGGTSSVRARWKAFWAESLALTFSRGYLRLAFWLVVALLLVAYFNMEQVHGR